MTIEKLMPAPLPANVTLTMTGREAEILRALIGNTEYQTGERVVNRQHKISKRVTYSEFAEFAHEIFNTIGEVIPTKFGGKCPAEER